MNDTESIRRDIQSLITGQKLGVLCTYGQGQPYASLVAFAGTSDLKKLVFATPNTTRKFVNLVQHPQVSLLVNSSANQDADIHEASAVTVTGAAAELEKEGQPLLDLYLAKHPHLEEFVLAPTSALVAINVQNYYLVRRFQQVMRLEMIS